MKDKIVVLDTNVLLHDPEAPHRFGDLRVVIPMQVVEEIDRFKKDHSEKGRNARRISRLLDCYRARGSLADGVPIEGTNHGMLQVVFCQAQAFKIYRQSCRGEAATTTSSPWPWSRCDAVG
jgi:PhoH-like ATPase